MRKAAVTGISIALLVFSVMFFGRRLYFYYHPLMTGQDTAILVFNVSGFLLMIVPGYIAAIISRQNGLLLGAVTGLLGACIVIAYQLLSSGTLSRDWYGSFIWGICFGAFGGLLWSLQSLVMRYTRPKLDNPV